MLMLVPLRRVSQKMNYGRMVAVDGFADLRHGIAGTAGFLSDFSAYPHYSRSVAFGLNRIHTHSPFRCGVLNDLKKSRLYEITVGFHLALRNLAPYFFLAVRTKVTD